jgi:hypothetical protein
VAAWDIAAKIWKLVRDVEDLFRVQGQTVAALEGINGRLRALEVRMTRLEAAQQQPVVEARSAAGAAATVVAGAVISDVVTRITRIEMRAEADEQWALPPP